MAEVDTTAPAAFSVTYAGRLVAYIWQGEGGSLRRAGANNSPICSCSFAEVWAFDVSRIALLQRLIGESTSIEALNFKLGMEEMCVEVGALKPSAKNRGF